VACAVYACARASRICDARYGSGSESECGFSNCAGICAGGRCCAERNRTSDQHSRDRDNVPSVRRIYAPECAVRDSPQDTNPNVRYLDSRPERVDVGSCFCAGTNWTMLCRAEEASVGVGRTYRVHVAGSGEFRFVRDFFVAEDALRYDHAEGKAFARHRYVGDNLLHEYRSTDFRGLWRVGERCRVVFSVYAAKGVSACVRGAANSRVSGAVIIDGAGSMIIHDADSNAFQLNSPS